MPLVQLVTCTQPPARLSPALAVGDFLGRGFRQHSSFSILGGNKKKKKRRKFVNWLQQFERFVAIATLLRSVLQGAAAASLLLFPTLCTPHEVRKHPPNAWVCSPHRYPGPEVTKKSQGLFRRLSRSCATRTGSPRDLCPPDHVVRAHDGAALTGDELRALPVLAAANKPTPCTI